MTILLRPLAIVIGCVGLALYAVAYVWLRLSGKLP